MKRIIIGLFLISTLVMLSGCSSSTDSKVDDSSVETSEIYETTEPTEPTDTSEITEPTEPTEPTDTSEITEPTDTSETGLTAEELYALGNESYSAGLSRDAFNYYTEASEMGSAEAYCMLAHCYEVGVGTSIDNDLAYKYYEISANAGCDRAQFRMGFYYTCDSFEDLIYDLYALGLDEEQAEKWFLQVADNSNDEELKLLANEALDYIYGGYPSYCNSLEEAFGSYSFWGSSASAEVDFSKEQNRP